MKLQTNIAPRRDGTLRVTGLDGKTYEFKPCDDGGLQGDIEHEDTLVKLLAGEAFWPADPEDYARAENLLNAKPGQDDGPATGDEPPPPNLSDKPDEDLDLEDDEGDPNALPVEGAGPAADAADDAPAGLPLEANTPPQTSPDRAAKRNTAIQRAAKAK